MGVTILGSLDRPGFKGGACMPHARDGRTQRFDTLYPVLGYRPVTLF